jgi:hypothetical protein
MTYVDPAKLPHPVTLHFEHTDKTWPIEEAVALIGRHGAAAIRLESEVVATRHAVLFRFGDGVAVFDLGSRAGVSVNGEARTISTLRNGDRIGIGPCTLITRTNGSPIVEMERPAAGGEATTERANGSAPAPAQAPNQKQDAPNHGIPTGASVGISNDALGGEPLPTLAQIGSHLSQLQSDIAESWERLNTWQSRLQEDASKLDRRGQDLATREERINAKDAALRGHLHDVTQYSEQIAAREQELAAQLARVQKERDETARAQREMAEREKDLARQAAELKRRENVVAQRWARLLAATCPHCRQPLRLGTSGPTEPPT